MTAERFVTVTLLTIAGTFAALAGGWHTLMVFVDRAEAR